MGKVMASETMKKAFCFLFPAILAIVLVLSHIPVARAAETGAVPANEEMKTEQMAPPEAEMAKQAPVGETQAGMSESGKSGDPEAKDAPTEPAQGEAAGGGK